MKFLVLGIGGDARYAYTAQALREDGCTVTEDPAEADVVILPFHATQDGVHVWGTDVVLEGVMAQVPAHALLFGASAPFAVRNYLEEPGMRQMNAIPTAEGALTLAMQHSPKTIWNSRCLVIGNGHVGNYLAKILCGMGAHVTQTARSAGGLAHAAAYGCQPVELSRVAEVLPEQDIIFNSVPAPVLDEAALRAIRSDAWLIEIAAGKHGFDPELAGKLGVHFVIGQKLPGTFSPYTGGCAIAEAVVRMVREAQAQAE